MDVVRTLREQTEALRRAGARGVELLHEHTSGQRWSVSRGRAQQTPRPEEERLTVRVWADEGRLGVRSGAPSGWDELARGALADAAAAAPDPHGGPIARHASVLGGLGILDRRYGGIGDEDREEVLVTAERSVRAIDRRFSPSAFTYEEAYRVRRFVNSRGVILEEADTVYRASGSAAAPVGAQEVSLASTIESRTFASIASMPFGAALATRLAELMGPSAQLHGPVRVLLPPLAVARLIAALAERFSVADFAGDGWFLRPRPNGPPAVDPRLHLQDDGAMPGGLRSWSFDDRGVAPVALTLLREGRVDGRFVDPEAAHRYDVRPTGNTRAGRQQPSNLILRSGTRSMSAVLADLGGTTLAIDDLPDLSGLDFATGQLTAVVHGVVMDGNRPAGAVRARRLTGDLGVVLNRVVDICSDTDRIGHVDAPGLIVDGFALDG